MKKLLILLLFFGFSFGQVKSISGVYKSINDDEYKLSIILNSDNTGIYSFIKPGDESSYDVTWEIRVDESQNTTWSISGLLLIRPNKKYNDYSIIQKSFSFQDLNKHPDQENYKELLETIYPLYTGKNKILYVWTVGDKFLDTSTVTLEGF